MQAMKGLNIILLSFQNFGKCDSIISPLYESIQHSLDGFCFIVFVFTTFYLNFTTFLFQFDFLFFPVLQFLLFSCLACFCTLRPFQIVLITSELWKRQRREIRRFVGRRVQGIASCVPSFYTVSQLGELRNLPITAPHMQNGEL